MTLRKRTPCVGICSTTYGDLVCRGCKRFAHEIVQWNGYDTEQQERVWERLIGLRDAVVTQFLHVEDEERFVQTCTAASILTEPRSTAVYAVLSHLAAGRHSLTSAGLELQPGWQPAHLQPAEEQHALTALQAIDAELYSRSVAHYERNFKIPL